MYFSQLQVYNAFNQLIYSISLAIYDYNVSKIIIPGFEQTCSIYSNCCWTCFAQLALYAACSRMHLYVCDHACRQLFL